MVNKPSADAGIGIGNVRVAGPNQVGITYVNNTASAVTPSAETYNFCALNEVPSASKITLYGVNVGAVAAVAGAMTVEVANTVNGVFPADVCLGVQKPTLQAGLLTGSGRVSAANTVQIDYANVTASPITPTGSEVYSAAILSEMPGSPLRQYVQTLSPSSVAANTTAEQTFIVNGLVCINSSPSTVVVNKPSGQAGLSIAGARISAANTLCVTYQNNTGAPVTPASEIYTIGNFQAVGTAGGFVSQAASATLQQVVELANELQATCQVTGQLKGA